MPAEMQRTQLVAKWTLSSSHHRFQNAFSLYWESVKNAYDTCEKYTGAHEHNISYYYWTQRLKRNQTRKQNETSINGLHLSEKLSKSDLVFKTTKFSFHLGINGWTTNTSPGRKIAPNTGANATKFFTLATKSWKLVANLATRISNHTLRRDLVIVEDL